MISAKELPHSVETERAILGAVMLDSASTLPRVTERLSANDFYSDRHQRIFKAVTGLDQGVVPDLRTVQAALERSGDLERCGGVPYLASLDLDLPDVSRIAEYVEVVKERSVRRALVALAGEVASDAVSGSSTAGELIGGAQRRLTELGERAVRSSFVELGTAYGDLMNQLEDRTAGVAAGIKTGFVDVDRKVHGLRGGNLVVIAGRPGMGKTTLAMNIAQNVAIRGGKTVAVFSLEMSVDELVLRIICAEARVEHSRFRTGYVTQSDWQRVVEVIKATAKAPLVIDDSPYLSATTLTSKVRNLHAERGVGLVVVDYLQLLTSGQGRHENRNLEVASMTRSLKQLAKELDIPVLLVAQLSRATERRGSDCRPRLSDLRESGAIEQDADMVAFIYRDEIYNSDTEEVGVAELIVGKHRNGETGTVRLVFDGARNRFESMAHTRQFGDVPAPF